MGGRLGNIVSEPIIGAVPLLHLAPVGLGASEKLTRLEHATHRSHSGGGGGLVDHVGWWWLTWVRVAHFQDQARAIKAQLTALVPTLRCFLDVDDLEDIGALEALVDATDTVVVSGSHSACTLH